MSADEKTPEIPLPANAAAALARGSKMDAIKGLRETSGLGLMEAKLAVERHIAANPVLKQQFAKREAEFKRRALWWVIVMDLLIVAAIVWWWLLR